MRIQSSAIEMSGQSYKHESLKVKEELIQQERRPDVSISHEAPILDVFDIEVKEKDIAGAGQVENHKIYEISEEDYQKVKMLEKILSYLTGKEVKFTLPKRLEVKGEDGQVTRINNGNGTRPAQVYKRSVSYKHEKSMTFNASGKIQTEDGREIEFNLNIHRSEKFHFNEEVRIGVGGQVVDPLVIHYSGDATSLTKKKYDFDLDFDGSKDQISFLSKGSGFLAFDKNGDGKINDGRELFGPQTGDGFKELAKYDEDGNGFIDENDSIFDQLRIWEKDENGKDVLFAIGEVGVGAIYLGHVATDYALGDSPLSNDGFIRSTGLFIKESGQVGSMHHIDLSL